MSSATVFFVLERFLRLGTIKPGLRNSISVSTKRIQSSPN